ncbi:hypothetical protein IFM89_011438 [Coptis chinensis]|uniref:RING-type E3 ubiquitin transferase n=1 Tax=Coptis chinensis TaxID=261450 RepID=A0A835M9N0_9MAGN|nr:hypothetical protein IFM89_011438 [Coptis chinensis]
MGSVCCCLHVDDIEEFANPNSWVYRNCICLRCFIQNCLNVYTTLFRRGEVHAIPLSIEGAASMTSTATQDNSLSDMYSSPPRPLPYDADPRCFHLQNRGLVSRREKGSSHLHEESEPLRIHENENENETDLEPLNPGKKWNGSDEGGSKGCFSDPPMKYRSTKVVSEIGYLYASSEEEDVCPTCLEVLVEQALMSAFELLSVQFQEVKIFTYNVSFLFLAEYTPENPKIITRCSHHFHLGCIYEWMERSESCPVCGKNSRPNILSLLNGLLFALGLPRKVLSAHSSLSLGDGI